MRQIPDACVKVFQTAIEKWGSKGTLDFGTAMLNVTLDILGYVAFGNHIGAVEGKLESTELWTELENFLFNNVLPKRLMLPK